MSTKLVGRLAVVCAAVCMPAAPAAAQVTWFGSVEALLLSPKVNSQGFDVIFYDGIELDEAATPNAEGDFDDALQGGVRFIGGAEGCDGFGVQFRYFLYDNDVSYSGLWDGGAGTIPIFGDNNIDVDALDIEVTQRGVFRSWDFVVTGGLRYGSVEISQPDGFFDAIPALVFGGATGSDFDGVGPTFSFSGARPLVHNLSLFGRARTALLFGDIDYTGGFRPVSFTIENEFVQVWEFQFGLDYAQKLRNGATAFGRVFWEAQRWDSESGFLGDLALHGLGLSGGLVY